MKSVEQSLKNHLLFGAFTTFAFVGGLGSWAVLTNLSGAVVANGTVVVEGLPKKVQHPTGGVVTSILVKEGMRVKQGDVLLKLDETVLNSNAQIFMQQGDENLMRIARLEAEQAEARAFDMPQELKGRENDLTLKALFAQENALFISRISTLNSLKKQYVEKIHQSQEEIQGLNAILASRQNELSLINRELTSVVELEKKGYALLSRLISLKRDQSRMNGDVLNTTADLARAKSRLSEGESQLARLTQETQRDRSTEIRDTKAKLNESKERAVSARDQLQRAEIRAPHTGIVHQLSVNTIGGVVTPSEAIMVIVPENETLIVEAKIQQSDIDQVHVGEKATLKFPSLNQRTTPEIQGRLIHVGADISKDKEANYMMPSSYYVARISLDKEQLAKLNGANLVPGMVAETYIHTTERSALSYLMKPITDQMSRAFKER